MFSSCVRQRGALRFFFGVSIIWFSFIKSRLFLSVNGYCVNMIDKIISSRVLKNNTWSRVQLEENSLSTHARVLFSIYHINSNINGLWLLKQWKIGITNRQWCSNFPWSGRKLKKENKPECFVLSGFGNGISGGWEAKSILQLKDLPQANFGHVPERFFLSIETNSITENFVCWKLGPLIVFVVIQRMFSSWVRHRGTLRFFLRSIDPFIFIH